MPEQREPRAAAAQELMLLQLLLKPKSEDVSSGLRSQCPLTLALVARPEEYTTDYAIYVGNMTFSRKVVSC